MGKNLFYSGFSENTQTSTTQTWHNWTTDPSPSQVPVSPVDPARCAAPMENDQGGCKYIEQAVPWGQVGWTKRQIRLTLRYMHAVWRSKVKLTAWAPQQQLHWRGILMQLPHLHLIFPQCFLVILSSPTGEWHNSMSWWESVLRSIMRKKYAEYTNTAGREGSELTKPCIFHLWKMSGGIFRTPPVSRTPETAALPSPVLSRAPLLQSSIAPVGLLWHRDTHIHLLPWC